MIFAIREQLDLAVSCWWAPLRPKYTSTASALPQRDPPPSLILLALLSPRHTLFACRCGLAQVHEQRDLQAGERRAGHGQRHRDRHHGRRLFARHSPPRAVRVVREATRRAHVRDRHHGQDQHDGADHDRVALFRVGEDRLQRDRLQPTDGHHQEHHRRDVLLARYDESDDTDDTDDTDNDDDDDDDDYSEAEDDQINDVNDVDDDDDTEDNDDDDDDDTEDNDDPTNDDDDTTSGLAR